MQSSNRYTKRRPWVLSTLLIAIASVGGAIGINSLWLNPSQNLGVVPTGKTTTQTVMGDVVQYRYGVVQLEITVSNGKVEKINEVQATASRGYTQAFPKLNEMALNAQSADFGNLSGATFVSEAYAKALSNALSKLS